MTVKVKICGITNLEDGLAAADAGADLLGFVFYEKSPRFVTAEIAEKIIRDLPRTILKVGLFVNAEETFVSKVVTEIGLDLLQFHGDETPDFCNRFGLPSIKAFRLRGEETLQTMPAFKTYAWLLDAYAADSPGGTGQKCDWTLAAQVAKQGRAIFLAGGLTPANVAEAVLAVRPFAVDVSSGVESSPGRKDKLKVGLFIKAAKSVAEK